MFKRVFRVLKDYETIENNGRRLEKGFTENKTFTQIYKKFYK